MVTFIWKKATDNPGFSIEVDHGTTSNSFKFKRKSELKRVIHVLEKISTCADEGLIELRKGLEVLLNFIPKKREKVDELDVLLGKDSRCMIVRYYKDGQLHREDSPACIEYHPSGSVEHEEYWLNGQLHREDGPTESGYYSDGTVKYEEYRVKGQLHREDGPASIGYFYDGTVAQEVYYLNGQDHREGLPAAVGYYPDGSIERKEYWLQGQLHRKDGPAIIFYNEDGTVKETRYYLHGILMENF